MKHTIEVVRLRADQISRLYQLHCAIVPLEPDNPDCELFNVELPGFAHVGTHGRVVKGSLDTVRHSAVIPLDPPSQCERKKTAPPTMFKRVVWTDESPARIVGMTHVEPGEWAA
jgi:hypothetical protein